MIWIDPCKMQEVCLFISQVLWIQMFLFLYEHNFIDISTLSHIFFFGGFLYVYNMIHKFEQRIHELEKMVLESKPILRRT